jgi:hypothetical protein
MTMRDQIAALLWRTEAVDSGTPQSVIDGRTPEAFADQSPELRRKWFKYADAIFAALPGMGPDLVWDEISEGFHRATVNENHPREAYEILGNSAVCYAIHIVCGTTAKVGETYHPTMEAAKAAANAHHRAAIAKAAGWTNG